MGLENNIPEGWFKTTIGELAELLTDYVANGSFASLKENVTYIRDDRGYARLIRLADHNKNYVGEAVFVDEHSYMFLKKSKLYPRDLIISNVGEYSGTLFRAPNLDIPMTLGPNSILMKFGESDDYMFYFLQGRVGQHLINSVKSGSANPKFNKTEFKKIEFIIPPLPEQKAIAKVLTAFDDKIELLQAQNKTLETMAQTIFKEWFGKYQKESSPPNGWRTFSLSELVDTINGYSYKGKELVEESNEALVTLKSFDRNGGFQTRGFKPFKGLPKTQHEVKIGDLIVAHTDLTQEAEVLGNPAFIFDNGGFEKIYITMDLVKVISKNDNIGSSFLYYLMKDRYFKGHCVGYSNGTTVLHLSKKAIPEYELYLPENFDLIKKFTKIAKDTTNKISLNKDAIKALTKTRDTLLPKLMSGQVRVNNTKQTANA